MHLPLRVFGAATALASLVLLASCSSSGIEEPTVVATPISTSSSPASPTETVTETVTEGAPTPSQTGGSNYYLQDGVIVSAGLGEAGEVATYPACDGRAVLILDSVIDEGNDGGAMYDIAQQVLMMHPSGEPVRFAVPGACPSLRAQVDGHNVYPIYIDYGTDVDAMCRAKATYGGNGRLLSNAAEYVDPC
ncbi:hypothetical protein V6D40_00520 [Corynebacterium sp. Q4381]|uniref:hypothetical protein n=1 Tax=Corynebacterium sp. Marseille-Q4381 TaxID=3121597 RepID=UPI002FE5B9D7